MYIIEKKFKNKVKLLFFGFLFLNYNCISQVQKNIPVSINKYATINKTSIANVRKIVKDNFGFLWLATQDGLFKYDGIKVVSFNSTEKKISRKLLSNDISDVYFDSTENMLYALNAYLGVIKINTKTNSIIAKSADTYFEKFLAINSATRINGDSNNIFISTNTGKIIKLSKQLEKFSILNIENDKRIEFFECFNNNLVFGCEGGIIQMYNLNESKVVYSKSINTKQDKEVHFPNCIKRNDELIISSSMGLLSLSNNKKNSEFIINFLINSIAINQVYECYGKLFYSSSNGFFSIDNKIICKYETLKNFDDEKWLKNANAIINDKNNLYIGSPFGLASVNISKTKFEPYYLSKSDSKLKISHAISINPIDSNKLLIGDFEGAFMYNLDDASIKLIKANETIFNAIKLQDEFMISGLGGSYFFNSNLTQINKSKYSELNELASINISQIDSVPNKYYFFSSEYYKGVFIWDILKRQLIKIPVDSINGLKRTGVNRLLFKNNQLYILCDNEISVYNFQTKKVKHIVINNPDNNKVLNILMDMVFIKTDIWLAVYGVGLVRIDEHYNVKKIIGGVEGLNNVGLYKLFNIGDSSLLVSSNNGLFYYNIFKNKVITYFEEDGLNNNAFEEGAACIFNNKIIMGGINGFTVVNPANIEEENTAPLLYFQNINVKTNKVEIDTNSIELKYLEIPSDYLQVRLNFIGLNYNNSLNINYWYKIDELHKEWIALDNQNFIDLIGLTPGNYNVNIKARDINSTSFNMISLKLKFLPKWYQTLLFKLIVIVLIAGILYALYKFRIRQLLKVHNVRQKISSNLHDDIGSTLSSINMYSQIAQLQPNEGNYINTIQENTQEVLAKLDDIVWATNPKNDKIKSVVERMDNFARPLLQAKKVSFLFNHNDDIATHKISEMTRQNLFLIFKEAINNVAKYSKCKNCTIHLGINNKIIYCTIADDGIGFDTLVPTERNGLVNMKLRATEIKGTLEIESKLEKGTIIKLQLPL